MDQSCFLCSILLVGLISGIESAIATSTSGNETNRIALLDFKNHITEDPFQIMPSWNDSLHFCNWVGVKCNPSNQRVTILNLESQKLFGSVPPSIENLTFLTGICPTTHFPHFNLSYNSFSGKVPSNITHYKKLTVFYAHGNELLGQIPEQLSSLSSLLFLSLDVNKFSGKISAFIGNLSSFNHLSLRRNNLLGVIPEEIGYLSKLGYFAVPSNEISGTIPLAIYNISSLYHFSVANNRLHEEIPQDLGHTLPNLKIFLGGLNNFTGSIPVSLSNASGLQKVDFSENMITGHVPLSLGFFNGLLHFNFDDNKVGNGQMGGLDFIDSLSNCTSLEVLRLARNQFGGQLPNSIANLSNNLKTLTLGSNMIYGSIPDRIGNLVNLTLFGLENLLNGIISDSVGKLQQLKKLYLNENRFAGPIPSSLALGNLTSLASLFLQENILEGSIPPTPSLGNCNKLVVLNLNINNLSGTIPKKSHRPLFAFNFSGLVK